MPSHHHPQHSSAPYPPSYPPHSSHPGYHQSSRHVSNGPPPPVSIGGHGVPLTGPPDGPTGPPAMGNGHAHPHHAPPPPPPQGSISAVARAGKDKQENVLAQLASANENTWMLIGAVAEQMQDQNRAMAAFENALRHNPNSILGLNAVASIARSRDDFDKAIEYFQRILNIKQDNGEVWGSMGHCLLMKDDLPKAYTAYQQALYHLANPKEPKLWYGIGILYDRYGSFEHAEEAFSSVLKMDPNFEKANEIYFRLGIIYKHQRKYAASLECFKYILQDPPRPLTSWDIWFQLGHVYEQDRDYENARDAYNRVLAHQPDHAKVLQQLGWLHHQPGAPFMDQDKAVSYLTKSLETDGSDAQSWYLLGRAFMAGNRFNKAYEAYQQAVYRDGRNPTFWCSIGVLYYQINQYRDALDAYSRAIRLNSYIPEVWFNLGSLYESCNNQITDAIDAYTRAADLDPTNATIRQRLQILQAANANNTPLPEPPKPVDVHPSQYTAQPQGPYPPGASPGNSPRPVQMPNAGPELSDTQNGRALPPPPPGGDLGRGHSPGPFRGGAAPPPLQQVDESRGSMSRHAPLAPMDTDMPLRGPRDPRDHRAPDNFPPSRYDPAAEAASRRQGSPASPRRREGYPTYQPYYGRDRERDEWERRNSRGLPGPSPRLHERSIQAPGRQPSPRHPEYAYGYPPDSRAQYPYDQRREMTPSNGAAPRHPSGSYDDTRAPSPAPSSIVSASGRRKRDDEPRSAKKEKSVTKKSSGDKKTSLKVTLRTGASSDETSPTNEEDELSRDGPHERAPPSLPSRTVDEDYDEGAADALMFLHGDRPTAPPSPPGSMTGTKRPASPSSPPTSKKARPEAVSRLSATNVSGPGSNGSASPAKRQVIEVLNTPSISSPIPRPASGNGSEGSKAKENETQEDVGAETERAGPAQEDATGGDAASAVKDAMAEGEVEKAVETTSNAAEESKEVEKQVDAPKTAETVTTAAVNEVDPQEVDELAPPPESSEDKAEVPASSSGDGDIVMEEPQASKDKTTEEKAEVRVDASAAKANEQGEKQNGDAGLGDTKEQGDAASEKAADGDVEKGAGTGAVTAE